MVGIPDAVGRSSVILRLRERARGFSGIENHHYVFPSCEHGHLDPTRHQKSFRTAWRNLTRAILCPVCGKLQQPGNKCSDKRCGAKIQGINSQLAGLRFHDLRHLAITELAESQVSDQTIMAIAGHVSQKMLARYSHVRARQDGKLWRRFQQGRQGAGLRRAMA